MNYITGMEVVQPLSNVIQLMMGSVSSGVTQQGEYLRGQVCPRPRGPRCTPRGSRKASS